MATTHERYLVTVDAKTGGAVQGLSAFDKQVKKSEQGFDKFAKGIGVSSATLKAGLASIGGAVIGGSLIAGAQRMITGYAEAAKAAGDLANATGSSVEEVTRMQAALQDAGVSAEASAGMLTKFTTAAGSKKGADLLKDINVALVKGKDGAVDYAATMVEAVDAISEIGDASERNRDFVVLFGKQGAQAFQDLLNSGLSLSAAMASIEAGRIITDDDLRKAQEFDEAMDSLAATGKELGNEIGRTLVPALTTGADALGDLVEGFAKIPGPVKLAIGAFIGLKAVLGTDIAKTAVKGARGALAGLNASLAQTEGASKKTAAALKGVGSSIGGIVAANRGLIAIATATAAVADAAGQRGAGRNAAVAIDNVNVSLDEQADALEAAMGWWGRFKNSHSQVVTTIVKGLEDQARATLESSTASDAQKAAAQDVIDTLGDGSQAQKNANAATEEGLAAQRAFAAALSASDAALQRVQTTQKGLADLLASGKFTAQEFADALTEANSAAGEQAAIQRTLADALDAAADATWRAIDATLASFNTSYAADTALRSRKDAIAKRQQLEADHAKELREGRKFTKAENEQYARDLAAADQAVVESAQRRAEALAAARDQEASLLGETFTQAERADTIIASLRSSLKEPGLTKNARADIQAMISDLEAARVKAEGITLEGVKYKPGHTKDEIQRMQSDIAAAMKVDPALAARMQAELNSWVLTAPTVGPLKVDGIAFVEGTTQEQVDKLTDEIAAALKAGNQPLATQLQGQLDALKVPAMPVVLTDASGKPLTETSVVLGVDSGEATTALDTFRAAAAAPATVPITYSVVGDSLDLVNKYNDSLNAKTLPIYAEYQVWGRSLDEINRYNDDLDGKLLKVNVDYDVRGDSLDKINRYNDDLDGKILTVSVRYETLNTVPVGVTDGPPARALSAVGPSLQALTASQPVTVAGETSRGGVNYSPTIVNNYPKPERVSDSIASSLRVARYLAGV